jgi:hypothetical protein
MNEDVVREYAESRGGDSAKTLKVTYLVIQQKLQNTMTRLRKESLQELKFLAELSFRMMGNQSQIIFINLWPIQ